MSNPLLDFSNLPLFDQIRPEHVAPALDTLLADANRALEEVTRPEFPARWDEIARVLETATERLGRAWGEVSHLNGESGSFAGKDDDWLGFLQWSIVIGPHKHAFQP